jgi:hypothetical protein
VDPELYVKIVCAAMGFYGVQFALMPNKIVRTPARTAVMRSCANGQALFAKPLASFWQITDHFEVTSPDAMATFTGRGNAPSIAVGTRLPPRYYTSAFPCCPHLRSVARDGVSRAAC